jgi:uncharacterized protein (DUF427 family)
VFEWNAVEVMLMSNSAPGFASYPNHRVTVTPSRQHVRVLVGEAVVADSRRALQVDESRHGRVWYVPPEDVAEQHLHPTSTTTYCPFKGHASYWTIDAGGLTISDAVWSYLTPYDECISLSGYYAFYSDRVRLEVDGQVQRPT